MGIPTSEVSYTSATTRRGTTKSMTDMWWHWGKNILKNHLEWFVGSDCLSLKIKAQQSFRTSGTTHPVTLIPEHVYPDPQHLTAVNNNF
jgi:hypothetical protein